MLAQLGSYEFLKRKFRNIGLDYTTSCFISGGLANVFCWLVTYPMDIVKTRLQLKSGEKGRIRDQAKLIWKSKGFLGFYQGIGATLCRAIVSGSFNFCTYEMVKKLIYN
jgi:Mitochondrial carrier protein.